MRVALTLPSLAGGGAQRVVLDLAQGLLRGPIEVGVDVVVVRDEGVLRNSVPSGARIVDLEGTQVSLAAPRLARYLRECRPDVVLSAITHMNLCAVLAARLVRPRVPVVVTEHNHLTSKARHAVLPQDRLLPVLARLGYPWADGIVAVSRGVAEDLASVAHLDPRRLEVIHNPVNFERVALEAAGAPRHRWLTGKQGPVLLGVGRLTHQKGFDTLLRAHARLHHDVRIVVLGEGPLRSRLERLSRDLGTDRRVDFTGFVTNPYPFYRASDAVVLSSRWEGLPTVVIEALFLGTPIVSADCPSGPAEILEEGRLGRLVPPDDPAALARAISETLEEERPAPDVSAPERFGVDRAVERYLDVLAAALGHRPRRPARPLIGA